MTCTRDIACGKVACRGCGCKVTPANEIAAEKTMKPHDWLIIMHATAVAMPFATEDMRREFEAINAKADLRYRAALDGRVVP